jgi:protein-S-isoprenylcysteine O-methyltransferase Ste14
VPGDGPVGERGAAEERTARLLVLAQLALLAAVVLAPHGNLWRVPSLLVRVGTGAELLAIIVLLVAATALGRGLTASPLPSERAQLQTGGLYRLVRHPIYSALLLLAWARTLASGSGWVLGATTALLLLLEGKARWEERLLARRFPAYAAYAAVTPRFVPRPWHRRPVRDE